MRKSIDILSVKYIDKKEIKKEIEKIATAINKGFNQYGDDSISLVDRQTKDTLELFFVEKTDFDLGKEEDLYTTGYGCLIVITLLTHEETDTITLLFLRSLLQRYPDLLVFTDEGPALKKPFVFHKADIDSSKKSIYAMLEHGPF